MTVCDPAVLDHGGRGAPRGGGAPWMRSWREARSPRRPIPPAMPQGIEHTFDTWLEVARRGFTRVHTWTPAGHGGRPAGLTSERMNERGSARHQNWSGPECAPPRTGGTRRGAALSPMRAVQAYYESPRGRRIAAAEGRHWRGFASLTETRRRPLKSVTTAGTRAPRRAVAGRSDGAPSSCGTNPQASDGGGHPSRVGLSNATQRHSEARRYPP